jgi:hypothetical protein
LNSIPGLLSECLKSGFSKSEKIQAYRLLTISYLYNDDPIGAEASFMNLLKVEPEYRVTENEPVELEHFSNQFITTPIISWRMSVGANASFVDVIHVNGTDNTDSTRQQYTVDFGFVMNGSVELHFSKFVSLQSGIELSSHKFRYSNELYQDSFVNEAGEIVVVTDNLRKAENRVTLSLPIALKFTYPFELWHPYAYLGYSPNFNFQETADASFIPGSTGGFTQTAVTGPKLDISLIRKNFTHSLLFGMGVTRRFGYKYGFIDVRYKAGLKNVLEENNQFAFEQNENINNYTWRYQIVDDDFRLNSLSISAGIVIPMYKARRKNTVTIQTVVQGWFKRKNTKDE